MISDYRRRPLYTNKLSHLTYVLSFAFSISGVLSKVRTHANVLTIHTNLSQRLSAVFVAVAGHGAAIGSSVTADLIHPVTRDLA